MPMSVSAAIEDVRAEHRRVRDGGMMPRLWRAVCREFERLLDRSAARAALRQNAQRT